ncbi:DUF6183 family protein [Streptomyces actinomycinicus]|nr:DUF6183 family protein [Streptomyces actinomycinicus]
MAHGERRHNGGGNAGERYSDYGIVALSPDGRRVAVLAATSTD